MVTLTLTSSHRPALFIETLISLYEKCSDKELISEIVWSDDHSDDRQFLIMKNCVTSLFPKVVAKIQHRTEGDKGLSTSLNWILDNISNNHCLHLEDDWRFVKEGPFIKNSLSIMKEYSFVKQVLLKDRTMFKTYQTKFGVPFTLWERGQALDGQIVSHCGFTLNPSVVNFKYYHNLYGKFNGYGIEGSWCDASYEDGIRTACLGENFVEHIGLGMSSFDINGTPR